MVHREIPLSFRCDEGRGKKKEEEEEKGKKKGKRRMSGGVGGAVVEDRKKEGQGWGQFDRNANIRVQSMVDDNEVWNWKRIRGKLLGTPVSYE